MIFEFICFIVILIVMVVVIIKRQIEKNKFKSQELDDSAIKLQLHLEEAADMIVERMHEQVEQLNYFINEADLRIATLDGQIKRLEALKAECGKKQHREQSVTEPVKLEASKKEEKSEIKHTESTITKKVFSMLKGGYQVDVIAKETGVGKGAILLIKQMYMSHKK